MVPVITARAMVTRISMHLDYWTNVDTTKMEMNMLAVGLLCKEVRRRH